MSMEKEKPSVVATISMDDKGELNWILQLKTSAGIRKVSNGHGIEPMLTATQKILKLAN